MIHLKKLLKIWLNIRLIKIKEKKGKKLRKKKLETNHLSRKNKIPELRSFTDDYNDNGKKYLRQRKVNQKDQIIKPENKMTSKEKCEKCLEILKSNSNQLYNYF